VDTPQGDNPPQIEAVTPDTKLITVSVGGNDIVYNGTAVSCGDPTSVCTAPPDLDAKLASARTALADMLDRLKAAAPKATIVFVTYPREVPQRWTGEVDQFGNQVGPAEDLSDSSESAPSRTAGASLDARDRVLREL
jgi:hypothetical protein